MDWTTLTISSVTIREIGRRVLKRRKYEKKEITPFTPTSNSNVR
jgi:hypothetical protein